MTCNGRYGTPPFFVIMPEGTDEDTKTLYLKMAMQCISNSCGTLPPGADVKAVSVPASTPDMFLKLIDLSTQELVLRSTNGQMTMLTAPGAGTNTETGSTHEDGFDDLAAAEGKDIAGVLNRGMVRPIIEQWHPGQEIYVELEIKHPEADDTVASVTNISQLAGAGYRTPDDQVQELTGYNVTTQAMPGADGLGLQSPLLREMHTRYAPTMLWPAAREAFDQSCMRKDCNSRTQEPALSKDELDTLRRMAEVPGIGEVAKLAETLQDPLKAAMDTEMQNGPQEPGTPVATPLQIANLEDDDERKDTNGKMSRSEAARHAARVRWGQEGRTGRNRGVGREGETRSGRSNTPLKAGQNATVTEKVDAVEKAIRKTAAKGGRVQGVAKIGSSSLTVEHGSPGQGKKGTKGHGSSHAAAKHFADPQDTDARKAARAAVVGKKSKDAKSGNVRSEHQGTNTVLGQTGKKRAIKMITAHKKK